jgi:hypothetical protein
MRKQETRQPLTAGRLASAYNTFNAGYAPASLASGPTDWSKTAFKEPPQMIGAEAPSPSSGRIETGGSVLLGVPRTSSKADKGGCGCGRCTADSSEAYVRAREDAKCGNGAISPGEKCTKGTALSTALKVAGGAALATGALYAASRGARGLHASAKTTRTAMTAARKLRNKGEDVMVAARRTNIHAMRQEPPNQSPAQHAANDLKAQMRLQNAAEQKAGARREARAIIQEARKTAPPSKARARRAVNRVLTRRSIWADGFAFDESLL